MYRLLSALMDPLPLGLLVALAVIVLLWRRNRGQRRGLTVLGVLVLLIWACSTPAAAILAARTLERGYPRDETVPKTKPDAIVVLSCGIRYFNNGEAAQDIELDPNSIARCLHAARVYREAGPCPIVASGGIAGDMPAGATSLGEIMRRFLITLGVKPDDVLVEDKSRSTHENAVESIALLKDRPRETVVLVTDAAHMYRSQRCFETQGQEVVPAACNYRATRLSWNVTNFVPAGSAVATMDAVVHEWIGLLWYRIRGRV